MNHYLAHMLCYYEYLGEDSNRRSRTFPATVAVRNSRSMEPLNRVPIILEDGMRLRSRRVLSRRGTWWLGYTEAIKRG